MIDISTTVITRLLSNGQRFPQRQFGVFVGLGRQGVLTVATSTALYRGLAQSHAERLLGVYAGAVDVQQVLADVREFERDAAQRQTPQRTSRSWVSNWHD